MEENKRCTNCGKYPFCEKTNGASNCCEEWIKRDIDMKLNKVEEDYFEYERLEDVPYWRKENK